MAESIVLCVDDEKNVLHALTRELRRVADRVLTAESGAEGLDILRTNDISVVVSDMRMPEMDGAEFLGQVRSGWPDTFRIMLTGYADMDTVTAGINEGEIHRFLVKPWNSKELRQAVAMGFERNALIAENRQLVEQLEVSNVELQALNDHLEERVTKRTEQLEQAYRELAHSEKLSAVGRLAAGVVHEVLNPLTVATGRLQMMQMASDLPESHQRNLQIAVEQIARGVEILDNLRDFSKQKEPKYVSLDVNELVANASELMAYELRKNQIEVAKEFGGLRQIKADRDQLGQVLLNLVGNAIEAMSEGDQLKLITRLEKKEGQEGVSILIADTGEGISEENLNRIFDPFFTSKEDGTGLGLSICQGIVENHGGQISVASFVGQGTTFQIWLPLEGNT